MCGCCGAAAIAVTQSLSATHRPRNFTHHLRNSTHRLRSSTRHLRNSTHRRSERREMSFWTQWTVILNAVNCHSELDSESNTTEAVHGHCTWCWVMSSMTASLMEVNGRVIPTRLPKQIPDGWNVPCSVVGAANQSLVQAHCRCAILAQEL